MQRRIRVRHDGSQRRQRARSAGTVSLDRDLRRRGPISVLVAIGCILWRVSPSLTVLPPSLGLIRLGLGPALLERLPEILARHRSILNNACVCEKAKGSGQQD